MPGFAFDSATSSSTFFTFRSEFTTSTWIRSNRVGDRLQALLRIERHVLDQELVVDDRIGIDDADRIAVGRRILAGPRADILHAARPVLDHDRLAERGPEFFAERAHEDVADAAGAGGGEHADRPRRPVILRRGRDRRKASVAESAVMRRTDEPPQKDGLSCKPANLSRLRRPRLPRRCGPLVTFK